MIKRNQQHNECSEERYNGNQFVIINCILHTSGTSKILLIVVRCVESRQNDATCAFGKYMLTEFHVGNSRAIASVTIPKISSTKYKAAVHSQCVLDLISMSQLCRQSTLKLF